MAIPDMSREEIIKALKEFDKNYRGQDKWNSFNTNKNHKYAINYNNNLYPVKEIIRIAGNHDLPTFSGGKEANNYLRKRNFEIVELKNIKNNNNSLLLRKKVNWSMFKWGITISLDKHNNFYDVNGEIIEKGKAKDVKLAVKDQIYQASLRNINSDRDSGVLQLRYDNKEELINLIKEEFNYSYTYIDRERRRLIEEEDMQRPQVEVPDDNAEYIEIHSTEEPYKYKLKFESKKDLLIGQKLRSSLKIILEDYTQARANEEFAGHKLGDLLRNEIPEMLEQYLIEEDLNNNYKIKGSIGQGNWARVPWLAIMDQAITSSTRNGVYITYCFAEDMDEFYLTLMLGVSEKSEQELINARNQIRKELAIDSFNMDNQISLSNHTRGKKYELGTICYRKYQKDNLPDTKDLLKDLKQMVSLYKKYKSNYLDQTVAVDLTNDKILEKIKSYIKAKGFAYPDSLIKNFYLSLKTKPFVLLAGISGTGKTKLVKLFAEAINCNFELIPVRPDWSDSSDLLGYNNLKGEFNSGPLIKTIKQANENPEEIYIICLDEMNLARVEYYFSDLLSIMETREKYKAEIKSKPLLTDEDFRNDADRAKYSGLYLSDNLYIVGTVNMDETTHPFSKKVLDRANTIEFSEIDLANYSLGSSDVGPLAKINNCFLQAEYLTLNDCSQENDDLIKEVVNRLQEVNKILKEANLQVGYRVRDEISFYLIYNNRYELLDFKQAFDLQLMQKILPRIQGSEQSIKEVLLKLFNLAANKDYTTTDGRVGNAAVNYVESKQEVGPYPKSAQKLAYMIKRYEQDGFTAYWL